MNNSLNEWTDNDNSDTWLVYPKYQYTLKQLKAAIEVAFRDGSLLEQSYSEYNDANKFIKYNYELGRSIEHIVMMLAAEGD